MQRFEAAGFAMVNTAWFHAKAVLAVALCVRVVKSLFQKDTRFEKWSQQLLKEGIQPSKALHGVSCVGCGRCVYQSPVPYPMEYLMGSMRVEEDMQTFGYTSEQIKALSEHVKRVCPVGVRIVR
jgi:hypothetical protein